ncbi:MAG TPA: hypothetical protein VMF06_24100 [Candidatus Limnocylindria bacterium]|nr:hypothetical protein [Candidatus Limnocylindria bacterium]
MMIPLVASRLVRGWHWHPAAFVILGVLLFGIGLAYQLVTRNHDALAYRAAVVIAFVAGFLLTWSNLVQSFDVNRDAAMYFVVPVVGLIGVAIARLRPKGMAFAALATALTQTLVLAIVLIRMAYRYPDLDFWTLPEFRGLGGNAFLGLLFGASALLFWKVSREEAPEDL